MGTILLVEDDDVLRTVLKRILTGLGHSVREASNGMEASLICLSHQPDLVITDIVMPESEGLGLITNLHRKFPQVKIIAMSGGGQGSSATYLQLAQSLGAHYTLDKPFAMEELLSMVHMALGAQPDSASIGSDKVKLA